MDLSFNDEAQEIRLVVLACYKFAQGLITKGATELLQLLPEREAGLHDHALERPDELSRDELASFSHEFLEIDGFDDFERFTAGAAGTRAAARTSNAAAAAAQPTAAAQTRHTTETA